jgi:molybdate transport system substrate-binding protein
MMQLLKFLLLPLTLVMSQVAFAQTVNIAVASNMKPAFEEIYASFSQAHPNQMRIIYGSSGNFATQIRQGAPFSLFIAADESFPARLSQERLTRDDGAVYAVGQLALIVNKASSIRLGKDESYQAILAGANKVAIANPALAPYGNAAVQYLRAAKLWGGVKDKLVYGENISVPAVYVSSGVAGVGFTALSLAQAPELAQTVQFIALPINMYQPIKQRMVLLKNPPIQAVELYDYMQSTVAKNILIKHGYLAP